MGRFVRPEPIEGTTRVTRVFDQVHVVHRACRILDSAAGPLDDVRDRLRRLSKVQHGNLARLVAVGEEGGRLMVVSEWLPGGQLARSHIPNPGRLLPGVAEALYALHRNGLAHGSVSASKFLLDGDDVVKLVDACVLEGSVPEDIEQFGRAMIELYAGRSMPPELEAVAKDAQTGKFGDATLLAVAVATVCAELPPVSPGQTQTPRPLPSPEPTDEDDDDLPLAFWLFLALLPASLLLWAALLAGWWTRTTAPIAVTLAPQVRLAPSPVVVPAPVAPPPEPGPPLEVVAIAVPGAPRPATPTPAPYVEGMHSETRPITGSGSDDGASLFARVNLPAPEPPAPGAPPTGAWERSVTAGSQHPTLVLSLDASNTVQDRLGRAGRPRLVIRCAEHRLSVQLQPGVQAVERVLDEVAGMDSVSAAVQIQTADGSRLSETLRFPDPDGPLLVFPNPGRWVNQLAATSRIDASYTPFASDSVVARFETEGLPHLLGDIRENCKL